MAAKVIKVLIIKNDLNSIDKEIYCVKLNLNEDLAGLKEKLYFRCSLLRDLEYEIYWIDSENDEILITCDDDFKFFVDESHVTRLMIRIIQDEINEADVQSIRKRLHRPTSDDQQSKKLRSQMENIELSTSGSSISDLEGIISDSDLTATSTSSSSKPEEIDVFKNLNEKTDDNDVMMDVEPSFSKIMETTEQTRPNIIHVEYLPNLCSKSTQEAVFQQLKSQKPSTVTSKNSCSTSIHPSSSSTSTQSKIVISDDSSDGEKTTKSSKKPMSSNLSHTSTYAFVGNDINGEFTRTSILDSMQRPCIANQFKSKSNRTGQKIRQNKAIIADLKAQLRSAEYQRIQRERTEEQQRRSQDYVRRAQQQAGRFSRRVSTAAGIPPGFFANIHHSVEQTLRSTRDTVFKIDDINQKVFHNF